PAARMMISECMAGSIARGSWRLAGAGKLKTGFTGGVRIELNPVANGICTKSGERDVCTF
ncbi:MAG: hypothetical protein OXC91_13925, partial [Rhodobacteraceae bacterium]|nr:hypothetical protein [Paracoccaceae bacterium]